MEIKQNLKKGNLEQGLKFRRGFKDRVITEP